jgi:hypothetical protein
LKVDWGSIIGSGTAEIAERGGSRAKGEADRTRTHAYTYGPTIDDKMFLLPTNDADKYDSHISPELTISQQKITSQLGRRKDLAANKEIRN